MTELAWLSDPLICLSWNSYHSYHDYAGLVWMDSAWRSVVMMFTTLYWPPPLPTPTLSPAHTPSPGHAHPLHNQSEGPIQDCASTGGSSEGGEGGCLWPAVQQVLGPPRKPLCCVVRLLPLGWVWGEFGCHGYNVWKGIQWHEGVECVWDAVACSLAAAGTY